jgi:hypothetical protein
MAQDARRLPWLSTDAPDVVDTVAIYSGFDPTGEEGLSSKPDTGSSPVRRPTWAMRCSRSMPSANDPFTIETLQPRLSSSALTMIDEPLTLVESGTASPIFRTAALRLPNNLAMEIALPAGASSLQVSSVRLRTGVQTIQEAATLAQAVPQAAIFSGRTPQLGDTVVSLRSMDGSTDAPRVVDVGLSSSTRGLNGFYLRLSETGIATGRFMTEAYTVVEVPAAAAAPPPVTLVGIENNPPTEAGVYEPVWIVARGFRDGDDGLDLDGDRFDLTSAPLNLPVRGPPPAPRMSLTILFVSQRVGIAAEECAARDRSEDRGAGRPPGALAVNARGRVVVDALVLVRPAEACRGSRRDNVVATFVMEGPTTPWATLCAASTKGA